MSPQNLVLNTSPVSQGIPHTPYTGLERRAPRRPPSAQVQRFIDELRRNPDGDHSELAELHRLERRLRKGSIRRCVA